MSVPEAWALGLQCDYYHNAAPAGAVKSIGRHWSPVLVLNVQRGVGKLRYIEQKVEHRVKRGSAGSCGTKRRGVRTSKHVGSRSSFQAGLYLAGHSCWTSFSPADNH